mgnify:CR=1 FL=1
MKVVGGGVDHISLGGNSDTVGMHILRKIASLTEYVRNFSSPIQHANVEYCVATILEIVGLIEKVQ